MSANLTPSTSAHCGAWSAEHHLDRGSIDCGCGWGAYCELSSEYVGPERRGGEFEQARAIVATAPMDHRPEHDFWMTHPADKDYLPPAERWCRVCARPDREHICTTCNRRADDRYDNPAAGEHCADKVHEPFYPTR